MFTETPIIKKTMVLDNLFQKKIWLHTHQKLVTPNKRANTAIFDNTQLYFSKRIMHAFSSLKFVMHCVPIIFKNMRICINILKCWCTQHFWNFTTNFEHKNNRLNHKIIMQKTIELNQLNQNTETTINFFNLISPNLFFYFEFMQHELEQGPWIWHSWHTLTWAGHGKIRQ